MSLEERECKEPWYSKTVTWKLTVVLCVCVCVRMYANSCTVKLEIFASFFSRFIYSLNSIIRYWLRLTENNSIIENLKLARVI